MVVTKTNAVNNVVVICFRFLDSLKLFSPANYFSWPAKYGLIAGKTWKHAETIRDTMHANMDAVIKEHMDTYRDGVVRDLVDAYLAHHKSASPDSSFYSDEGGKLKFWLLPFLLKLFTCSSYVHPVLFVSSAKPSYYSNGPVRCWNGNQCNNIDVGLSVLV